MYLHVYTEAHEHTYIIYWNDIYTYIIKNIKSIALDISREEEHGNHKFKKGKNKHGILHPC